MKISFKRTGGFANIPVNIELDTDKMEKDKAQELQNKLKAATATKHAPSADMPDMCHYELTINDGTNKKNIVANDGDLTDELSSLFDFIMDQ